VLSFSPVDETALGYGAFAVGVDVDEVDVDEIMEDEEIDDWTTAGSSVILKYAETNELL
jgi:hypothetical protein